MSNLITKVDKQLLGRLCADAISNLDKACEKHPTFPDSPTTMSYQDATDILATIKRINDTGDTTAQLISYEEQLEFNIEVSNKNLAAAYKELVDLITVWLRVGLHLNDYIPNGRIDNKPWMASPFTDFTVIRKTEVQP
jgi:hypothetical protein